MPHTPPPCARARAVGGQVVRAAFAVRRPGCGGGERACSCLRALAHEGCRAGRRPGPPSLSGAAVNVRTQGAMGVLAVFMVPGGLRGAERRQAATHLLYCNLMYCAVLVRRPDARARAAGAGGPGGLRGAERRGRDPGGGHHLRDAAGGLQALRGDVGAGAGAGAGRCASVGVGAGLRVLSVGEWVGVGVGGVDGWVGYRSTHADTEKETATHPRRYRERNCRWADGRGLSACMRPCARARARRARPRASQGSTNDGARAKAEDV